jgi:hypothetical protein
MIGALIVIGIYLFCAVTVFFGTKEKQCTISSFSSLAFSFFLFFLFLFLVI